tara:strand:- start:227 stop:430 length:204 start_codon:yes stop_codon:yes gene_type:complete
VRKVTRIESDTSDYGFGAYEQAAKKKIDLNVLLAKVKEEKRKSKKAEIMILSGAATIVLVFLMLLSF